MLQPDAPDDFKQQAWRPFSVTNEVFQDKRFGRYIYRTKLQLTSDVIAARGGACQLPFESCMRLSWCTVEDLLLSASKVARIYTGQLGDYACCIPPADLIFRVLHFAASV